MSRQSNIDTIAEDRPLFPEELNHYLAELKKVQSLVPKKRAGYEVAP